MFFENKFDNFFHAFRQNKFEYCPLHTSLRKE